MNIFSEMRYLITTDHGQLEMMVAEVADATATAIICHPHSQMGGTMNNKVVTTVARAWHELNFNTIRFNFRGVGASTGIFDHGIGEQQDLLAIVNWASNHLATKKIILGGFSFGAYVALLFCQHYQPSALLLIAPPTQYSNFQTLQLPKAENFLIVAEADEVVSAPDTWQWAATKDFQGLLQLAGASHFFHGKLLILRDAIIKFFSVKPR